ncbi:MAG: SDR family oxidoreductase [Marinosulfonomonas sp.]
MKTVFIAGATGYLGKHLVAVYRARGWHVRALVRNAAKARTEGLPANELIQAEATRPDSLQGVMDGVDLVISSLGITRQKDGLDYWDVDYQANANLLDEALAADVERFAYVHVLGAELMLDVPLVEAKQAFVEELTVAPIDSTIIAPSGYFSDMADFLTMAKLGRVWGFGSGQHRLNPIHGADLATATADAIEAGQDWLDVGGPEIFTQDELASLAFAALGLTPRITHLPDWIRRAILAILPRVTPAHVSGPIQFFLTALGQDMVGEPHGRMHLADHFNELASKAAEAKLRV